MITAALLALTTLFSATFQTVFAFGFSMVAAPVFFVLLPPVEAVTVLLMVGTAVQVFILTTERRRPEVQRKLLVPLVLASLPGMGIGIVLLNNLSQDELRVVVALSVFGAALLQLVKKRGKHGRRHYAMLVVAGLFCGATTTSTSINGPPLLLALLRQPLTNHQLRDTATATLLILNSLGFALIAATGHLVGSATGAWYAVLLLPIAFVAHTIGIKVFRRVDSPRYQQTAVAVIMVVGLISMAQVVLSG